MAVVNKVRRLINPGRKKVGVKRKLTALQKMFFGSKRQRAAVKVNGGKKSHRKIKKAIATKMRVKYGKRVAKTLRGSGYKKRKRNVGSIVTVWPSMNPGVKRRKRRNSGKRVVVINKGAKMATIRRRRKNAGKKVTVRRRRRSVVAHRRRRYSRNPGVVTRRRKSYSRRGRRHVARRHTSRRRNPGVLTGTMGRVLGMVGGLATTKFLMGFVPAQFSTGLVGYLATGAVAVAQGKLVGKLTKSSQTGTDFMIGGLALMVAKAINDFFPTFGGYTGISGMGMIGGSSFYTPQVNQPGSMGSFVLPQAVSGAIAASAPMPTNTSLRGMRRYGRM